MTFGYEVARADFVDLEARLTELGEDGWELVWVNSFGEHFLLILKRPK